MVIRSYPAEAEGLQFIPPFSEPINPSLFEKINTSPYKYLGFVVGFIWLIWGIHSKRGWMQVLGLLGIGINTAIFVFKRNPYPFSMKDVQV